jgi:DNA-binding NarL/FixJ family response regulator
MRVAIADDNNLLRNSLIERIKPATEVELCGAFADGSFLVDWLQTTSASLHPQVILMDIEMPTNGIDTTRKVKQLFPDIEIIMLTVFDDEENIFNAIEAGAVGYLLKEEKTETILSAIKDIKSGGSMISAPIARKILVKMQTGKSQSAKTENPLTERESEILFLVTEGMTNPQIAEKLFISYETVRTHVRNIYEKLQVGNRTAAAKKAKENRWFSR